MAGPVKNHSYLPLFEEFYLRERIEVETCARDRATARYLNCYPHARTREDGGDREPDA